MCRLYCAIARRLGKPLEEPFHGMLLAGASITVQATSAVDLAETPNRRMASSLTQPLFQRHCLSGHLLVNVEAVMAVRCAQTVVAVKCSYLRSVRTGLVKER